MSDFISDNKWYNLTIDGKTESVVKGDIKTKDSRIIWFSTNESLKLFAKARSLGFDGTFKICPTL